jgi:hypothetical protein
MKSPSRPTVHRIEDSLYGLFGAILEQAVADYRALVRQGHVVNGVLTPAAMLITDTTAKAYMTCYEMMELIEFFYSAEYEKLCNDIMRIPIDPEAVRSRIGLPRQMPRQLSGFL